VTLGRCGALAGIVCLAWSPAASAAPADTREARLLRTVQIGTPQAITVEDIKHLADRSNTDYSTTLLARSALLVLRQDEARWTPYEELLDGVLNQLVRGGNAFQPPPGLPDFRGKETLLTMAYAMVMSGREDRLVALLERHLLTGSRYKHAVVVQALRNVGTPRAVGIIQKYAETGENRNLADATLADQYFPVLSEVYQRWGVVPPAQRTRAALLALVRSGCSERSAMASYWLGFFAPDPDPMQEQAELVALRGIVGTRTPACGFMARVIALKSLALRSTETVERWETMARDTANVWERHQIVINAFGRWGQHFAPTALRLLGTEPTQYVQWELMQGTLETRKARVFRTYWDIWLPVNLLVVLDDDEAQGPPGMEPTDLDALLSWLESGARPGDAWVANHMLFNLAGLVRGDDTRRYLRLFNAWPKRNENFWILTNLAEPAAEPLLRYWSTLPAPDDQTRVLNDLVTTLERKRTSTRESAARPCCRLDEACLLEQLAQGNDAVDLAIRSEDEARQWLAGVPSTARRFTITYTDELKRSAAIRQDSGAEERWEFLYDCWRRTTPANR
jgi:hypothetical protein